MNIEKQFQSITNMLKLRHIRNRDIKKLNIVLGIEQEFNELVRSES